MGRLRDVGSALFGRRAGYGVGDLRDRRPITVTAIGGQQSLTIDLDAESRGYSHSAVAYRCVAAIADNGSSVPLEVHRADGSVIDGHPIAHLFNKKPNDDMSARVYKSIILQQAELAGQHFTWLDRGETGLGPVSAAHPIFDQVDVVVDKPIAQRPTTANIIGFMIRRLDGVQVPVLPEEMLWLRYPHPFEPLGCLAPWKAARHAVDMDAFAREWQRSSYQNGATPTGVVYVGDMEETQFNATKASWRSSMQGPANAGKNLLVASQPGSQGKGIDYVRVGLTAEEMDYLESRVANREEVMLAFGVPHDYLSGGTTFENRTASKATLWSDTIVPKLEIIGSEIDRILLPSDAEEAAWDLSGVDALQESQSAVVDRTVSLTDSDILTLDEARATVGYEALPGGAGAITITAYRAQYNAPPPSTAASGRMEDVGVVVERAVETALTRLLGQATPVAPAPARPALTRGDGPSSPSLDDINADYDRLEAAGRSAVRALARDQAAVVLRDFDRLMAKPQRSAEWLTELRQAAAALAVEDAVRLAPPDLDVVTAASATRLDVAAGPDGWEERIRVSQLFDPRYWRRRTSETLRPFVERVWQTGGASVTADFTLDEPDALTAMDARLDALAGQVTATTEQIIRSRLLQHGVAQGESIPELRARIQAVFTELSDWRATMIARTETVGGYSAASLHAARASGATTKTWLATDDTRTRATHRSCNGRTTVLDGRFPLTQSRWPADPEAPANQSIQCRCALTYGFAAQTKED